MIDDSFMAAVLAEPAAEAPRLVYADWLEERDDPRAEFLRLESAFLNQTAPAPRSRALGRLRTLCQTLDPDWIALMRRQPIADAVEVALAAIELQLAGINYVVNILLRRIARMPGATPERYVTAALGQHAIIERTQTLTVTEMLNNVETCLRYRGTPGSGPRPGALRSKVFKRHLSQVLDYLRQTAKDATRVEGFWLRQGHPFYPIMWDFAFVLAKPQFGVVLIGSSSD